MTVLIDPRGTARALYSEVLDLTALGACSIQRASRLVPFPWTVS